MGTRQIQLLARAFAILAFVLAFSRLAHATTTSMDVGTLSIGSTNNKFLLEFGLNGSGLETPNTVFLNDGSIYSYGSQTVSYSQASNPTFTFDFSFSVWSPAILSQDLTYITLVGSSTSSISLMQGADVVDTGVQPDPGFGYYFLPSVTLQPDTPYDLVVTTLGVPSSLDPGFSGTEGWGQIALDVSSVPEPDTLPLLATGFLGIAGLVPSAGGGSNLLRLLADVRPPRRSYIDSRCRQIDSLLALPARTK